MANDFSLKSRASLHRSISQLIRSSNDDMTSELGASNPALDAPHDDAEQTHNAATSSYALNDRAETFSGVGQLTADSEYDETLAFPDSVTILSMGGDNPVLVERKDDDDAASIVVDAVIPFTSIYNTPVKFSSIQRKVFIQNVEILVSIIDNDRSITTHLLNPNLYTIQLTHGDFVWTIKKRYKHFNALHQQLRVYRASLNFPFPTRSHKERRASFRNNFTREALPSKDEKVNRKRRKGALPRFPNRPESLVPHESLPLRIKQLEEYLYNLLNISLYRNHRDTVNFLEVSQLSFISGLGDKGKEGLVQKRTGSTRPGQAGCNFFGCLHANCCVRCNYFCSDVVCGKWRNRWFFVKETCFGYIRPKDGAIRCVVLFDQGMDVSTGIYNTGMRNGLQILTNNRHIVLKCWTRRQAREWMTYLKSTSNEQARDFTNCNPHLAFAPVRTTIQAGWFVDGASYMAAVADALDNATEEIYIADWWLSPEIYMKRPAIDGDYWRLDKILQRKAAQGVRVFVLLYKEVDFALGINSYYSKQKLVCGHENIRVLRHPDHARVGVFFWAHHEKIVAIDQTYAFIGGIDLCYGRWDDYRHRLTDLGSVTSANCTLKNKKKSITSQKNLTDDLKRNGLLSYDEVDSFVAMESETNKMANSTPKLKARVHLSLPLRLEDASASPEPCPENLKQNTPEMERKNMLGKFKDNMKIKGKDWINMLSPSDSETPPPIPDVGPPSSPDEVDGCEAHRPDKNIFFSGAELADGSKGKNFEDPIPYQTQVLNNLDGQAKFWIGKDYVNFIFKDFVNLDAPFADLVDRSTTPRMPWHDVGVVVAGASARDISRHFIQRWNATKLEKTRDNHTYPYLMPKSYTNIEVSSKFVSAPLRTVTCQVLRSVSSWSCGFIEQDLVEQSIHDAYIQTINKAQHYVYIENQFFISLELGNPMVRNQIAETLYKRILRAHREKRVFRVYVVMPLLPGFEGDVGGTTGNALRAITHWNYLSISRGKGSILSRLQAAGIANPTEYISFHSLRTYDILNGLPITELIYVHSKLLIADDKVVICGSANINDRSMIGKRDSEVAVIITDEEFAEGRMNGEPFPSGMYAGKLRKFLFKEHLGLIDPDPDRIPIDVTDPVSDSFWNGVWRRTSRRNTQIYTDVFKCIPCDEVTTFASLRKNHEEPPMCKSDVETALKEVERIQGNVVDLPLQFLCNEVLTPPGTSKEGIIPTSVWT